MVLRPFFKICISYVVIIETHLNLAFIRLSDFFYIVSFYVDLQEDLEKVGSLFEIIIKLLDQSLDLGDNVIQSDLLVIISLK